MTQTDSVLQEFKQLSVNQKMEFMMSAFQILREDIPQNTVLNGKKKEKPLPTEMKTMADLFARRLGNIQSSKQHVAENETFADYLEQKREAGHL